MTKHASLSTLAAFTLATLFATGCAVESDPSPRDQILDEAVSAGLYDPGTDTQFWDVLPVIRVVTHGEFAIIGTAHITDERGEESVVPVTSDVCGCTTADCVSAWIEEELGCGLCATATCTSGGEDDFRLVGGCVPCEGQMSARLTRL